jgi:zinc transport system permease protein
MAYFGDALAHSALLGIALGFLLNISLNLSIAFVCLLFALLLVILQKHLTTDTLLGILSHSALSLGLVAISFVEGLRIDLMAYLFGDLLAITVTDLYWIYGGGSLILIGLIKLWPALLSVTVHEELAIIEGINVRLIHLMFMLMVALIVAVAMKIIGILLITSLLIIPAATAHVFARTPEQMAWFASFIGCCAVIIGLSISWYGDTPTGPSIVLAATLLFTIASIFSHWILE